MRGAHEKLLKPPHVVEDMPSMATYVRNLYEERMAGLVKQYAAKNQRNAPRVSTIPAAIPQGEVLKKAETEIEDAGDAIAMNDDTIKAESDQNEDAGAAKQEAVAVDEKPEQDVEMKDESISASLESNEKQETVDTD